MFDYNYLDEAKDVIDGGKYNLYFVLLGDRVRIKNFMEMDEFLVVDVRNDTTGEMFHCVLNVGEFFGVCTTRFLNISIGDLGNKIRIEYTQEGIEYIKRHHPDKYIINQEGEELRSIEILAKALLDITYDLADERIGRYEVLYIGQSKQDSIFNRLSSHNTLQRIHREVTRKYADKDVYVMLSGVWCKVFNGINDMENNARVLLSNSMSKEFELQDSIHRDEAIDIAEALLIAHFKPDNNYKLKMSPRNIQTYSKFCDAHINSVSFSLDLYWEETKEKTVLYTKHMSTSTKARIIICDYEGGKLM